jgi:hypothetical protein
MSVPQTSVQRAPSPLAATLVSHHPAGHPKQPRKRILRDAVKPPPRDQESLREGIFQF